MLANAGTPLMFFGFFYVTFANVALGLLEGAMLAAIWRASFVRSVLIMVAANLVSSWVGALYLNVVAGTDLTIANVQAWLWVSLAVMFALTLLVELPFVRWTLATPSSRQRPRPGIPALWRLAMHATLCVHAVSYPLMLAAAWWSGVQLLPDWTVVPVAQLAQPGTHVVFYMEQHGTKVCRRDLVSGGDTVVGEVPSLDGGPLFLHPDADGVMRLCAWLDHETSTVIARVPGVVAPTLDSPWKFTGHFWGYLLCEGPGQQRLLSGETPLSQWWQIHAQPIVDDVAFVTMSDQICLLKASTGEIALVGRGRGAVVAAVRR